MFGQHHLPLIAVIASISALIPSSTGLFAQTFSPLNPETVLGVWDFNDTGGVNRSLDRVHDTVMRFEGPAAFSAARGGHTGQQGDFALNLGTTGSAANPSHGIVTDDTPSGRIFMDLVNESNASDRLSVVFWQRWQTPNVNNSSTVWFVSPAAGSGSRGFHAHLPWGNQIVYFDTSGCCSVPTQRLNGGIAATFPNFDWRRWHHVALIKDGGAKQVWIDGQLFLDQRSGAIPLLNDWTQVILGHTFEEPQDTMRGFVDDFAVFATALDEDHLAALAAGRSPLDLALPPNERPPRFSGLDPANGARYHPVDGGVRFEVATVSPNSIDPEDIRLFLDEIEVTGALTIAGTPLQRVVTYMAELEPNRVVTARALAIDNTGRTATQSWSFDTFDPEDTRADVPLLPGEPVSATQSGGPSNPGSAPATRAIDGNAATFSETNDEPDSYWEVEFGRTLHLTRIELVAPAGAAYRGVVDGLTLTISDLRDQTVFETTVTGVVPGGTWSTALPTGVDGRIIRFQLADGATNGAGDHRVAIAEVRAYGDPSPGNGPVSLHSIAAATQSSDGGAAHPAEHAIDRDVSTYSQTDDLENSHWLVTLDRTRPVSRIELVNHSDSNASRMQGLTLRILDEDSNTVATSRVTNPGRGGTWVFEAPPDTRARFIRIGLEDGAVNGQGNHIVSLPEVSVLSGIDFARGAESYALHFNDGLPSASFGNDGNFSTHTETTERAVGAYFEVDLQETRALYNVRIVPADGFERRLTHATVRLYDENHSSVFARHLEDASRVFDVPLPGPTLARYVRVGYENKERSDPPGVSWYLGIKEFQAFGRPAEEVGILEFSAGEDRIASGSATELFWRERDLHELRLYPDIGSVGALVDAEGHGRIEVTPTETVEYALVGKNYNGEVIEFVTVTVDGEPAPVRISEFVADNRLSLRDGNGQAPDWIELHNPNNGPLDLAGHGLSDDLAMPMKWIFPDDAVIPPHGYMIIFASGRETVRDDEGFLHANFSLNAGGESIVVTAPDGITLVDSMPAFPPQREDLAYGRTLNGDRVFLDPTPGTANLAASYDNWLAPIVVSHARGYYLGPFTLSITHPDPDATILFSLDGSTPSIPYENPIRIADNACLRVSAHRSGAKPRRVQSHTYLFIDRIVNAGNMNRSITQDPRFAQRIRKGLTDLPTISISVPELPDDYNEREASVEIFWPDGSDPLQVNAGVTRFGGAWTEFAKKNYRLKFRKEYGARKLRAPLFDGFDRGILAVDEFDEIDLRGGGHDMNSRGFYMSARFSEDSMLDMGSLNPHGRFVHLFFNGVYWGQYHARERLTDAFLADYLGGASEDYVNVRGNDNAGSNFVRGDPHPLHREPWEFVQQNKSEYTTVRSRLDVAHLIDFMLMWNYGNAESEYRAAGPIVSGSGFKFWLGDADGHLRAASDRTNNAGPGGLFGALVAEGHPDFMTLLADRIYKHLFHDGALTPARNRERLDARMNEIADSLIAECARWGYRTPDSWVAAAEDVRANVFPGQTDTLLARLRGRGLYPAVNPPVLSQHGGAVESGFRLGVSAGGTVYYTLDGSDPRLPGGAVSPAAIVWSGDKVPADLDPNWRYWDRGSRPDARWNRTGFNDESWASGPSPLGFGNGNEATTLQFGPNAQNKFRTYYFRNSFTVEDAGSIGQLTLNLTRDDGAVVYLNGSELFRDNMPEGTVDYSTLATSSIGGAAEETPISFSVPANRLRTGANLLAVEIHQSSVTSSDIRFAMGVEFNASTELIIEDETWLRARALSGATWSALTDARFLTAEPRPPIVGDLLISEIHYNPAGSDDYEFLELFNASDDWLDLSGTRIAGGVGFLFPEGFRLAPGEFALVVENLAAFHDLYQETGSTYAFPDLLIAGEWMGRLANEGETVALVDADGMILVAISYQPGGAWPDRGRGRSLELRDPPRAVADPSTLNDYLNRGAHWRFGGLFHGSPGRFDLDSRRLVISELTAHPDAGMDWVELRNAGSDSIDLGRLVISDSPSSSLRYSIADGVVLEAGGFLVLEEPDLGFGFDPLGSGLVVFEAAGADPIRLFDWIEYPAVDPGSPIGRHERSDGLADFTELLNATPLEINAAPRVGPVVFAEIMYHPAAGRAEYVELRNTGPTAVALHDPTQPDAGWRLSGGVQFTFPAGQPLAPGELTLVCSSDPSDFRQQYGLETSIRVYGPWGGALNNAGESIVLLRPGSSGENGVRPYYRVDGTRYEPVPPWPLEADTGGVSLERISTTGHGPDPIHWRASAVGGTPGTVPDLPDFALQPINDVRYPALVPLEIDVAISAPGDPPPTIRFSAIGLPPRLDIDSITGRISGVAEASGTFTVTVAATDQQSPPRTVTAMFMLTIEDPFHVQAIDPGSNRPPRFSFQAMSGESYEIQYTERLNPPDWQTMQRIDRSDGGLELIDDPPAEGAHVFLRVLWIR